jgi:hypothetical protein
MLSELEQARHTSLPPYSNSFLNLPTILGFGIVTWKVLFRIIGVKRLLDEIKATEKRIYPDLHPLFNLTMQNKYTMRIESQQHIVFFLPFPIDHHPRRLGCGMSLMSRSYQTSLSILTTSSLLLSIS